MINFHAIKCLRRPQTGFGPALKGWESNLVLISTSNGSGWAKLWKNGQVFTAYRNGLGIWDGFYQGRITPYTTNLLLHQL